jgi:hypothetical protein
MVDQMVAKFREELKKAGGAKIKKFIFKDGKKVEETELSQETDPFYGTCEFELEANDGDVGFVATDGIFSMVESKKTETSLSTEDAPLETVLSILLGFKNYSGQFVARRMKAGLKELAEREMVPVDDLSLAAIHLRSKP